MVFPAFGAAMTAAAENTLVHSIGFAARSERKELNGE
jgi:hypothetical protein